MIPVFIWRTRLHKGWLCKKKYFWAVDKIYQTNRLYEYKIFQKRHFNEIIKKWKLDLHSILRSKLFWGRFGYWRSITEICWPHLPTRLTILNIWQEITEIGTTCKKNLDNKGDQICLQSLKCFKCVLSFQMGNSKLLVIFITKVESSIRIIRGIQSSFNHATQPEWSSGSNEVGFPADPACPTWTEVRHCETFLFPKSTLLRPKTIISNSSALN